MPGELELAEKHGVSRGTVRVALMRIQELGLVSRKKRAGTRVEAAAPRSSEYTPKLSTIDELVQYGAATLRTIHGARDRDGYRAGHPPRLSAWLALAPYRDIPHQSGSAIPSAVVVRCLRDGG
ncbi:GntR family transcriptional regulator [Cupriavidus basilensis]